MGLKPFISNTMNKLETITEQDAKVEQNSAGNAPEEHISQIDPVLTGRSYWGSLKMTAPGEPEFFLPRILFGFL